jgi:hypothetical protein
MNKSDKKEGRVKVSKDSVVLPVLEIHFSFGFKAHDDVINQAAMKNQNDD